MSQKHLLVVGGRDHTLDKIDALGVRYSMMQIPSLVNERQSGGAAHFAVLDYTRHDEALAQAKAWHAVDPFDAVVSFTEYGLEPASRCAAELGIAGDNLHAVLATRDKTRTRALLAEHGLSPVRYRACDTVEDAAGFMVELGGAAIVLKPCDGGLSEGVVVVETTAELVERWQWTRSMAAGRILVEEYLDGPEFSVESISAGGRHDIAMITEKVTTAPPRFVELGHQVPAVLAAGDCRQIEELVLAFLALIGQATGPAHTELRLTRSGPRIIESQTRFGGDQIWELCQLVSGVDLMSETVAALLGLDAPPRTPIAAAAAIRFLAYEHGVVTETPDTSMAERARGVIRIACSLAAGQRLGPLESSNSRQGYVLCHGVNTADAVANAEAAHDLIAVTLRSTEVTA